MIPKARHPSDLAPVLVGMALCMCLFAGQRVHSQRGVGGVGNIEKPVAISGRVVAESGGLPLSDATVTIRDVGSGFAQVSKTATDGSFVVPELPDGRYLLSASKTGFATAFYGHKRADGRGTPISVQRGTAFQSLELRLPTGSRITGQVSDMSGERMVDVGVEILRHQWIDGQRRLVPVRTTRTNDRGEYRTWDLDAGAYFVRVRPGSEPSVATTARTFDQDVGSRRVQESRSPTAKYAPTYYPGTLSADDATAITLQAAQEFTADVWLGRASLSSVVGQVTTPDGNSSFSCQLSLVPVTAADRAQLGVQYGTRTNADGSFTIGDVPPGAYVLYASSDLRATLVGERQVVVGAGERAEIRMALVPSATIRGRIRAEPTSRIDFRQMRIRAVNVDYHGPSSAIPAVVDQRGEFVVTGVRPGETILRVEGGGVQVTSFAVNGREVLDRIIQVPSTQTLTAVVSVTDRVARLQGRVIDSAGHIRTDRTIIAFAASSDVWVPGSSQVAAQESDSEGRFDIRSLPPGTYFLAAIDPPEYGAWWSAEYLRNQMREAHRIVLLEGRAVVQDVVVRD